jgi:putative Mn2+ efflux pump MntP
MAAWLNVLLMLGMVVWLRMALGALAIGGGIYSLKRGFSREAPVCTVTAPASRRKVLDELRTLALEQRFGFALIGIVLIAVAVNIVELICSAGIPAVYTQILALTEMPRWQYYAYLLLYVAVFMLDDLAVLVVTLGAITMAGESAAYSRWSNRIGGIILIGLGVLLLLRPDWLALG